MEQRISSLRLERVRRGLSLDTVAVRCGVDASTISRIERNVHRNPELHRSKIIDAICTEDAGR